MLAEDLVAQTVVMTFEEMAFLDVASGPAAVAEAPGEGPWLFLSYSRPKNGAFALFLPKGVKFAVAEAIYGEDFATLSPVQLDDSLLELMNVLAGRLLTARFGADSAYSMGLPTVIYDPPADLVGYRQQTFPFHLDENGFLLEWYEVSA